MHPIRRMVTLLLTGVTGALLLLASTAMAAPTPANHLVISEIMTDNGPGAEEFVELYNPTGSPVSLDGWSLQYHDGFPASDPAVILKAFGSGDVVPAYGYYLLAPTGSSFAADAHYDTDELSSFSGSVLLTNSTVPVSIMPDATIVDLVGYDDDALWYEGSPAAKPAGGESIERLPNHDFTEGNGTDTNNNAADFVVQNTPNPQNTQSPKEIPAGPTYTNLMPGADSYVQTTQPTIGATITDTGSGVDADTIVLSLNGTAIPTSDYSFNESTGVLTYVPATPIRQGTHTATITATDKAGYTTSVSWNFTVDTIAPVVTFWDVPPTTDQIRITGTVHAVDNPLGEASGVSEMQVAFDGIFDTEPWQPFSTQVTQDLMAVEGQQLVHVRVRDRAGNVSAIATDTIVLEVPPTVPPTTPVSTTTVSEAANAITITWPPVPGAVRYVVRYTDGETLFGPVITDKPSVTITGLDPNKTYRFEVASVSAVGTVSGFAPVQQAPSPSPVPVVVTVTQEAEETAAEAQTTRPTVPSPFGGPDFTVGPDGRTVTTPSPDAAVAPSPTPSPDIRAGEDTQPRDWTRVIVALSILIIAAGVATGGWYLYQWWTTRPKGGGKGGRW